MTMDEVLVFEGPKPSILSDDISPVIRAEEVATGVERGTLYKDGLALPC